MTKMREDAAQIIHACMQSALPDTAVRNTLQKLPEKKGKLLVLAIGKAAWQMSRAALDTLGSRIDHGICITKYHHVKGDLGPIVCYEAGHPVPDENSFRAAREAEKMVSHLQKEDLVLFLISGGGSALFEDPVIAPEELQALTGKLLACGADIREINTIRKHLSRVKGGRFAQLCEPASVFSIVLSDIIGDPLDSIASGPAYPDAATSQDAENVLHKYGIEVPEEVHQALAQETPKELHNVTTFVSGSVRQLAASAAEKAKELGYEPVFLTASLCCEASQAGSFLASIARDHVHPDHPLAYIAGGETVVHLKGKGMGGRNQETALAAAQGIDGLDDVTIFSVGSDGTDGPTDAAGGIVDGMTAQKLREQGISIDAVLQENDSYHALQKADGLIKTGPTGTNVNDIAVVLIGENHAG